MKNYLLSIFTLLIVGCEKRPNTEEEWPIKPTNEIAACLIELDSMNRAIMENPERTQYEETLISQGDEFAMNMQTTQHIADSVWHTFIRLCNDEKFEDAFNLYRHDNNVANITVALQYSTARYLLHDQIIAAMAFRFLPEKEAYQLIIRDFECDMLLATIKTEEKYIPPHYFDLVERLRNTYRAAEMWDKALEFADRMPEILSIAAVDTAYASAMMYKAGTYKAKGDILEALKTLQQLKVYLTKKIKKHEDKEMWQNMLQIVEAEIEKLKNKINE